jgi:hypothetical protein
MEKVMATAKNDVTGDWIQSKPNSEMFEKNFDAIFRKKKPIPHEEMVEKMLENPEVVKALEESIKEDEEIYKALAEYELNKSTGEVQKKD